MLQLNVFKLSSQAIMPTKAHTGLFSDACFDLFATRDISLEPGERLIVSTDISILIPDGYWVKFHERSGHAANKGIAVLGGVIDSGYTGGLRVILVNTGTETCDIPYAKAIAQFSVEKVTPCSVVEIDAAMYETLSSARSRGTAGFGSTGI